MARYCRGYACVLGILLQALSETMSRFGLKLRRAGHARLRPVRAIAESAPFRSSSDSIVASDPDESRVSCRVSRVPLPDRRTPRGTPRASRSRVVRSPSTLPERAVAARTTLDGLGSSRVSSRVPCVRRARRAPPADLGPCDVRRCLRYSTYTLYVLYDIGYRIRWCVA